MHPLSRSRSHCQELGEMALRKGMGVCQNGPYIIPKEEQVKWTGVVRPIIRVYPVYDPGSGGILGGGGIRR